MSTAQLSRKAPDYPFTSLQDAVVVHMTCLPSGKQHSY